MTHPDAIRAAQLADAESEELAEMILSRGRQLAAFAAELLHMKREPLNGGEHTEPFEKCMSTDCLVARLLMEAEGKRLQRTSA